MQMNPRQIEVLDFLMDDHFALWDFADTFPAHRPDAFNSANDELLALIESGHVALTYGKWFENRTRPVPAKEAEGPLKDAVNWRPYGMNPGYALELTELGRKHLRGIGLGPPKS